MTAHDSRQGVSTAERRLLKRLRDRDDDDGDDDEDAAGKGSDKRTGTPPLAFLPAVDVVARPATADAGPLGADAVVVRGVGPDGRANRGVLGAFIDLWDADAAAVAAFARRHGSLRLCPCGESLRNEPYGHAREVLSAARLDLPAALAHARQDDVAIERLMAAEHGGHDGAVELGRPMASKPTLAETRFALGQLRLHMAPETILAQTRFGRFPPTHRLGHFEMESSAALRAEPIALWRAEARRVRGLVVLAAFVAVALDECGADGLADPSIVPGCKRGIPFLPAGFVGVSTLLRESVRWHEHDNDETARFHTPGTIRWALVREVNRRLRAGDVTFGLISETPPSSVAPAARTGDDVRAAVTASIFRCGVSAPTLAGYLAVALAGLVMRTVSRGICRRPGCGRALTGRQTLICRSAICQRWADSRRHQRARPPAKSAEKRARS